MFIHDMNVQTCSASVFVFCFLRKEKTLKLIKRLLLTIPIVMYMEDLNRIIGMSVSYRPIHVS